MDDYLKIDFVLFGIIGVLFWIIFDLRSKLHEQSRLRKKMEENRIDERNGRIKAEKLLRNVQEQLLNSKKTDNFENNLEISPSLPNIKVHPIGFIRSIFKERNGTPRQGLLVPSSRGSIHFHHSINPYSSLDGLDHFSHLWIVFVFHENTNSARNIKQLLSEGKNFSVVKSKIRPPRLDGKKVGIFSTRTPHRFTPFGLTLAKIEKIEKDVVHLSGIDLIDGTPIVDIKPYVPSYDCVENARVASWISEDNTRISQVIWEDEPKQNLHRFIEQDLLEFYQKSEDVVQVIEEIVKLDIRSTYRRKKNGKSRDDHHFHQHQAANDEEDDLHQFFLDRLVISFRVISTKHSFFSPFVSSSSSSSSSLEEPICKIIRVELAQKNGNEETNLEIKKKDEKR